MTAPCQCDSPGWCDRHGDRKTEHLWKLCQTREDYRKLWDDRRASTGPTIQPRQVDVQCRYLRAQAGERECHTCSGRVRVKTFGCALHGECSLGKQVDDVACCATCKQFTGEEPTPLLVSQSLSPGDAVVLTGAVRELVEQHPGKFVVAVSTPAQEIWDGNPYVVTPSALPRPYTTVVAKYDTGAWASVNTSNQRPAHMLVAMCESLSLTLGLPPLRPRAFRGEVRLLPVEKHWISQPAEHGCERFVVLNAGGKSDYTTKLWPTEYFQRVVDHFDGAVRFVQVGALEHDHPKLRGVVDLVGKTTHRQLVRLMWHADAVVTGISYAMHLAAAVEENPRLGFRRPAFVLGGGFESPHWEAYPGHQFYSAVGSLPCCRTGGCWKARVVPLGDGQKSDDSLCVNHTPDRAGREWPACQWSISPETVIEGLERYFAYLGAT